MSTDLVGQLIIYIVVLLLAISAHEAAHAWMSHKFGDDTAYLLGRVTLNPVKHTDPIGTLLIPIVSFIGASSGVFVPLIEALLLNASLAVFNLLPIPPLDGSKVLYSVLPASAQPVLEALERYSF